jgi:hypothetical protein
MNRLAQHSLLLACFIVGTFSSSSTSSDSEERSSSSSSRGAEHLPQKEDLRQFNVADKIFMKAMSLY